ncbi:SOS response-associated peptidase family protein [Pedobacter antarcticus]|uniref:SOS response-associated peptidase family protein n=1 Tax=Pedobacter antarcticus TaxID=34086 RepID=UPI0009DF5503
MRNDFELSSFKKYAEANYCLITTTGFFEPHHNPDGSVAYYFISSKSRKAFCFGGLWKIWKDRQTLF